MDRFDQNERSLESFDENERSLESRHISAPPLPLVVVFSIVVFLLSLSQYSNFKSWSSYVGINLQLLLFLMPIGLAFFLSSSWITQGWWFTFGSWKRKQSMNLSPEYRD